MKAVKIKGVVTALVTPFNSKDKIDYTTFERLIISQKNAKIDGVVLFGTTGEGVSLSLPEKKSLILFAKRLLGDTIPLFCGISTPYTADAVKLAKFYQKVECDGILLTTPFYYKTTALGVFNHFKAVLSSCELPVMLYNVPKRTNCDISQDSNLLQEFSLEKKICGIKHAGISLKNSIDLLKNCSLPLFCGNDCYLCDLLHLGYHGGVCVVSNIYPKSVKKLYDCIRANDLTTAKEIFERLKPLLNAFEREPNPIPVKYAVSILYGAKVAYRLPLVEPSLETKKQIENFINNYSEEI